jgi:hypothetical protein
MGCISATMRSSRCSVRTSTDYFKRLGLPKSRLPCQAQTQGLQHDAELHDLGIPHLGLQA